MIITPLKQGEADWLALHTEKCTASQAPAMMGASKYQTRNALLAEKALGIRPEINPFTQILFDRGHAAEAAARPLAEAIIGEELYPVVGLDDTETMMASFDGLTMDGRIVFEHKLFAKGLADQVIAGELEDHYTWQLDHALAVSGAEKALFMVSNGTPDQMTYLWYTTTPERQEQLKAGWAQFREDLANYQHREVAPPVVANLPMALPALKIEISGEVRANNLALYQAAYVEQIRTIPTDLKTDEDFATAESMVKFLDKAEKEIEYAKNYAVSQASSIDELYMALDQLRAEMREKRLTLNRLVTTRKEQIRASIVEEASRELDSYLAVLNGTLDGTSMPATHKADLTTAIKNKRTVKGLRDACDDVVAQTKGRYKLTHSRLCDKLILFTDLAQGWDHLFPDVDALVNRHDADAITSIIKQRIADAQAAEERRKASLADNLKRVQQAAEEVAAQAQAQADAIAQPNEIAEKEAPLTDVCVSLKGNKVLFHSSRYSFYLSLEETRLIYSELTTLLAETHETV